MMEGQLDLERARRWRRRERRKRVKHALEGVLIWIGGALWMAVMVPLPRRWMLRVCDFLAAVAYRCDRRGRRRALELLHVITGRCRGDEGTPRYDTATAPYAPTPREERIIRRSYRNMVRTVGHTVWTVAATAKRVRRSGEVTGEVRDFLAANRPAITVSGHLGCWEMLSQLAYLEGHRMISVAKRVGAPGVTRLLVRLRSSIGQEIVPADGALKVLLPALREGKSLGLLVDQRVDPRQGGIWIRFLGRPLPVSAAPAFFAAKVGVPVIVAWSRPLRDGRSRCELLATYTPEDARDIWALTQRIAADLERVIRRHPSAWILNYNLFSNVPTPKDLSQLAKREEALRRSGVV